MLLNGYMVGHGKDVSGIAVSQKAKGNIVSTVSPSISHEVMGPDAMIFVF